MKDIANLPTVYIVDDDEAVRDSLKALLVSVGFSVTAFARGQEFLETRVSTRNACLLLDLRLPDISGLEIQQRLRRDGVNLPVIFITARGDVSVAVRAIKAGAADFVEKPFDEELILGTIESALILGSDYDLKQPALDTAPDYVERLTPRERDVLEQLVIGRSNKGIAFELGISPRTVEVHRARIMQKMEAGSLPQLVRIALAAGIDGANL